MKSVSTCDRPPNYLFLIAMQYSLLLWNDFSVFLFSFVFHFTAMVTYCLRIKKYSFLTRFVPVTLCLRLHIGFLFKGRQILGIGQKRRARNKRKCVERDENTSEMCKRKGDASSVGFFLLRIERKKRSKQEYNFGFFERREREKKTKYQRKPKNYKGICLYKIEKHICVWSIGGDREEMVILFLRWKASKRDGMCA